MTSRELAGIHHVKIPVTGLARSLRWYRRLFGLRPTLAFPDADGVVCGFAGEIPGLKPTTVAFRVNQAAVEGSRGFDPVSFAVESRDDLRRWVAHLDSLGVNHSPIVEASIGWLLVFDDPDPLPLHLSPSPHPAINVPLRPA